MSDNNPSADPFGQIADEFLERWNLLRERTPPSRSSFVIGPRSAKQ
jgi:hypothetical protein